MRNNFVLDAGLREVVGSSESRRLRKGGRIPSVICSKNKDSIHIEIPSKEFEKEYLNGDIYTSLIELKLDSDSIFVVVEDIDLHPVTDKVSHVNFLEVVKGGEAKVKVKVGFVGKESSLGIKRGGI